MKFPSLSARAGEQLPAEWAKLQWLTGSFSDLTN
jgi:hypothetical protein